MTPRILVHRFCFITSRELAVAVHISGSDEIAARARQGTKMPTISPTALVSQVRRASSANGAAGASRTARTFGVDYRSSPEGNMTRKAILRTWRIAVLISFVGPLSGDAGVIFVNPGDAGSTPDHPARA